jgi:hypothetical protein
MKVKASGITFRRSNRLRGRSRGAQNACCGLGSAVGDGFDAVFARICVLVVIAGVDGAIVTG